MLLDGRTPGAVLFDLDGTLTDNMGWHAQAFERFVLDHGLPPLTLAMRGRLDGKRNRDIFPILFGRELDADVSESYSREKESLYRALSRGRLQPLLGLQRLLDALARHGVPSAVATSAPAENVLHTLAEIGLAHAFPCVVRSDEVPHGKPAPDVFLEAAARVGVPPAECLVFEDAPMGVAAALGAGMTCIAVNSAFTPEDFAAHGAVPHLLLRDFEAYLAGPGAPLA